MTTLPLRRWLDSRGEEAPPALRARIGQVMNAHPEWEQLPIPEALMAAGELLMRDVLASPEKDRRTALDLLAADACVTYAFEAAASSPERLVALAEQSVRHIAQLMEQAGAA